MHAVTASINVFRQTAQRYHEQVNGQHLLLGGIAFTNPDFPNAPQCNLVDEFSPAAAIETQFASFEGIFADRGVTCRQWILADEQVDESLRTALATRGFQRRDAAIYVCDPPPQPAAHGPADELQLLPARAMRRAYRSLLTQWSEALADPDAARDFAHAQEERLNDAQYEAFVALRAREPVGTIGLFTVGPVGRLCDLFVSPAYRRRGVARRLLREALATARRWALRPLCATADDEDQRARSLFEATGLDKVGTIARFVHSDAIEAGA